MSEQQAQAGTIATTDGSDPDVLLDAVGDMSQAYEVRQA